MTCRWPGRSSAPHEEDVARATFAGILSGGDTEEEERAELARFLDDSELRYRVDRYGAATFVPKGARRRVQRS